MADQSIALQTQPFAPNLAQPLLAAGQLGLMGAQRGMFGAETGFYQGLNRQEDLNFSNEQLREAIQSTPVGDPDAWRDNLAPLVHQGNTAAAALFNRPYSALSHLSMLSSGQPPAGQRMPYQGAMLSPYSQTGMALRQMRMTGTGGVGGGAPATNQLMMPQAALPPGFAQQYAAMTPEQQQMASDRTDDMLNAMGRVKTPQDWDREVGQLAQKYPGQGIERYAVNGNGPLMLQYFQQHYPGLMAKSNYIASQQEYGLLGMKPPPPEEEVQPGKWTYLHRSADDPTKGVYLNQTTGVTKLGTLVEGKETAPTKFDKMYTTALDVFNGDKAKALAYASGKTDGLTPDEKLRVEALKNVKGAGFADDQLTDVLPKYEQYLKTGKFPKPPPEQESEGYFMQAWHALFGGAPKAAPTTPGAPVAGAASVGAPAGRFVPPNTWQFSPSRNQYRDPTTGRIYDLSGNPV